MGDPSTDRLIDVRRDVHRMAEPAWREFYTTSRIVDEVERVGVDRLHVGSDAYPADERRGVPAETALGEWRERAAVAGARSDVLDAVKRSDFAGTLKVFFQPAEEPGHGGPAMAASTHLTDVDHLLGAHVGLGRSSGEVVGGATGISAKATFTATITGAPAHAGKAPNEGRNAVQALAAAIQSLYGIPRHADGMTRINVGRVRAGTESNVVPAGATVDGEARGETTALMEYVLSEARRRLDAAATAHGCSVEFDVVTRAPRGDSDETAASCVRRAARGHDRVDTVSTWGPFGASDDYTHLMRAVQERGGTATYALLGTDHPTGHHTATFDVDEETIPTGIDVLTDAVLCLAGDRTRT